MKKLFLFVLFFYSVTLYAACSDFHSGGSCPSSCVWSAGSCKDPPNTAPTNISLSPSSVAENSVSGTPVGTFTTTDTAGNTHTYTLVSGTGSTDNASFTINIDQLLTSAIFDYETKNSYSIRVRSTDQGGLFFEKPFTITVTNVNEAPTVTSGASSSVNENIPVSTVVYAITATDPDAGQTLTYSISGTDAASFNVNASSGAVTFKASPDYETKSSYSISVIATDNGSPVLSASKAVTITVNNVNEAPTDISLDNASVAENQPSGTTVGNLSTTDPDSGNTFTYSLVGGDSASFSISGAQLKTASSFDFETKSSYSVTIRSTDQGGLTFDKIFAVSVTNVNEAPIITTPNSGNTYSASVAENTTAVADVDATDPENATLTYSLSGTDSSKFTINSTTGVITFTTAPDFETPSDAGGNNVYDFTVTVSDGSLSDTQVFAITVTNINETPIALNDSATTDEDTAATISVLSNDSDPDGNTLTLSSVTQPANGTAAISGSTVIYTPSLNFNGTNTFTYTISDGNGATATATVTVTVNPLNDAPTITAPNSGNTYSASVAENTTAVADVDATDIEGSTLTYSLSGTDASKFTIIPSTGVVTFTTAPDFESPSDVGGNNVYDFTVTVSDGSLTDTQDFNITVTNANEPPVITAPNSGNAYSANVAENTTAVADVNAIDSDAGQTLTYSLSGTDASKFTIIPSTGIVTFTSAPDYENPTDNGGDNIYNFTVIVSDNGSPILTDTQTFTITITDVNEFPVADYHLDECSWNGTAGEVKDSGPSALHGKALNGANTEAGKICNSGKFDGTNDYVDLGNVLNPVNSGWSISTWFKWNGKTGDNIIYNKENLYEAKVLGGYFQYAWMPHWAWDGGTSFPVTQNTWYHAVVTYDGITQKVYRNGVKVYERAQSGSIGSNVNKLLFGARGSGSPSSFFGGNIDEVQIFSTALTAESIANLYTNEAAGKNYDGSARVCNSCVITPPACTSFTYTLYHPASSTNKLQTRIAQQPFDLNISVACTSSTDPIPDRQIKKIYAVTGPCPAATAGLPVL